MKERVRGLIEAGWESSLGIDRALLRGGGVHVIATDVGDNDAMSFLLGDTCLVAVPDHRVDRAREVFSVLDANAAFTADALRTLLGADARVDGPSVHCYADERSFSGRSDPAAVQVRGDDQALRDFLHANSLDDWAESGFPRDPAAADPNATRFWVLRHDDEVVAAGNMPGVLRRAAARTPGLIATVADGAALPVRSGAADLVCFAQAWHWLDPTRRVNEMHRVLRPGGRWAGWWSHARADDEPWFDRYWRAIETACPGTLRDQRDTDWGTTIEVGGQFVVEDRITVPWTRHTSVDDWLTDQAGHSYVAGLTPDKRVKLLGTLRAVLDEAFSDGAMSVRYETWLWIATRT